jgi:hypothetical protein
MSQTSMQELSGTWYIVETNFPMWLKGNKLNPTLNYTITEKDGREVLLDEVIYTQNGKTKSITGYDYPDGANGYIWRGKGLLSLLKSEWEIVFADPLGHWAVSWFEKTLFTPEGIDIISRTPTLPQQTIDDIKRLMIADSDMAKLIDTLKPLPKP